MHVHTACLVLISVMPCGSPSSSLCLCHKLRHMACVVWQPCMAPSWAGCQERVGRRSQGHVAMAGYMCIHACMAGHTYLWPPARPVAPCSYDLMIRLQLGIRVSIGRIQQVQQVQQAQLHHQGATGHVGPRPGMQGLVCKREGKKLQMPCTWHWCLACKVIGVASVPHSCRPCASCISTEHHQACTQRLHRQGENFLSGIWQVRILC